MPLDDPSSPHAVPADAARPEALPPPEDAQGGAARRAEVARRDLVIRDGLDAVAAWEAANGALTDEEMAVARHRIADELEALRAIADWGVAEDWTDWAETTG